MKQKKSRKLVAEIMIESATKEEIQEGFKIEKGAIVDVEWAEARQGMLCPATTVGRVFSIDEKLLCIATTVSAAERIDLVAIPVAAIESVKVIIE